MLVGGPVQQPLPAHLFARVQFSDLNLLGAVKAQEGPGVWERAEG